MKKGNSKKIRSRLFRESLFGWTAAGAIIAFLFGLAAIGLDEEEMLLIGIVLFIVCVIIGIIIGSNRSAKFASKLKRLESIAAIPYDEDELQYLDSKKKIALGQDWLMVQEEKKINLLPKEGIASIDSHNERKPGMKKLWIHVAGVNRESFFGQYEACQPDILDVVAEWLGQAPTVPGGVAVHPASPAPAVSAAPAAGAAALMAETAAPAAITAVPQPQTEPVSPFAPETMASESVQDPTPAPAAPAVPEEAAVKTPAPGECPHCFGPNDPSAEVCQWCGSKLK